MTAINSNETLCDILSAYKLHALNQKCCSQHVLMSEIGMADPKKLNVVMVGSVADIGSQ
jgi:hypothetical protein